MGEQNDNFDYADDGDFMVKPSPQIPDVPQVPEEPEEEQEQETVTVPKEWFVQVENEYKSQKQKLDAELAKLESMKAKKPLPVKMKDNLEFVEPIQNNPFFWVPTASLFIWLVSLMMAVFMGFEWAVLLVGFVLMMFVVMFFYAGSQWMNWLWYQFRKKKGDWGYMLRWSKGGWDLIFKKMPEIESFPYKDEAGVKRNEHARILRSTFIRNLGTTLVIAKQGYANALDLDAFAIDDYYPQLTISRELAQNDRMSLKAGMELVYDEQLKQKADMLLYLLVGIAIILALAAAYIAYTRPQDIINTLQPTLSAIQTAQEAAAKAATGVATNGGSSITPGG